ncbi:MAG: bifunctional 2-polyprenyl-6-hydroxyphenol methylase/3-demethylubiquinol 3-O-methyltransferase UbiG [Deltaproteobacteria bacterium]|nr:bifunctional 2-polyprenyl-6-hydroxyphenol methylase/3-demethylubiquinol 3-O-methyltransferase UbiG [Deltaproteobacteria bacterium]MBW2639585.1 bifunctional 2-polyprenyl-6-hydroxyphenol methylase/3-demethylubiquinol 3-O-methyltransferase UbiG [Deltaproteobacteria bacterium]MBW2680174.1 bifunctional 2-polyprenyl-6-hydroxyphenol methylase/3-demethylubiquinol 3-O-methyltransferase UbiG [Deltaproteobacteria bacterium]
MAVINKNIDKSEISKFEALSSRWWDRDGEFGALHDINETRLRYINDRAGLAGKQVLDIGCGGGILSEAMAKIGAQVTGIDAGKGPIEIARSHMVEKGLKIDYRQVTAEAFAVSHSQCYDIVTCMELLEHVPKPWSIIKACKELVRPGGHVFFATLNRNPLSYLLAILAAEYLFDLVPRGTHQYRRFIKPSEMIQWAQAVQLNPKNVSGLLYIPLLRCCILGGPACVNYMAHFSRHGSLQTWQDHM